MAKQCPRCELRFRVDAEVRDHLIAEHGMLPEQLEHPYPRPGRVEPRPRPINQRSRCTEPPHGNGEEPRSGRESS
jgi:hypothetical protein